MPSRRARKPAIRSRLTRAQTSGVAPGYLHGYSRQEQDRLYRQARFLEPSVYAGIDFSRQNRVLEIGSGVGAQTEILLERFPHLKIACVDASAAQVKRARRHLAAELRRGQIEIRQGDALHLPYADDTFDGAFLCWLLEHVRDPVGILREARRAMSTGAVIHCTEVLNSSLYLHPYSPATLQYWFNFNDHQWTLGGDPFVGAKLGNYLLAAGFQNVSTEAKVLHFDNRMPKRRAQFIEYWISLLLSGAPGLIDAGRVTPELVQEMRRELEHLAKTPDAVFYYAFIQARAEAH
jgi:ubiquinone/menaquinone biosynthesis C-methylase UbiE